MTINQAKREAKRRLLQRPYGHRQYFVVYDPDYAQRYGEKQAYALVTASMLERFYPDSDPVAAIPEIA
jgi:hypothetical protein